MRKMVLILYALTGIGWTATVEAATATITPSDCQLLLRKQVAAGAAYTPGVDVRGKKVTPADIGGGSSFKLPKEFSFELGVDIAAEYGLDAKTLSAEMNIGKVTIKGGRAYMNDREMTTQHQADLVDKCQKLMLPDEN